MKKLLGLLAVAVLSLSVVGCGCTKEEEKVKPIDTESKYEDGTSRLINDFEALEDKVVGVRLSDNYVYKLTVYIENGKAKNAVMRITCPDEESAQGMFAAMSNLAGNKQVVLNENQVIYDYDNEKFVFGDMTKDEVKTSLENDGYEID